MANTSGAIRQGSALTQTIRTGADIAPAPEINRPQLQPASPARDGAANILLVDDNEVNCKVAVRFLKKLGYTSSVAHDGAEAVEAVIEGNYDLILMDCQMPVLDGYEATRRIR
ncbi:MAG: hypothetical protein CBD18_04270 [Opitutales bacterium TMED158]|nr:MAG: hypothetical protein CBD18_04270 [Opitutales bacterium TMED158]